MSSPTGYLSSSSGLSPDAFACQSYQHFLGSSFVPLGQWRYFSHDSHFCSLISLWLSGQKRRGLFLREIKLPARLTMALLNEYFDCRLRPLLLWCACSKDAETVAEYKCSKDSFDQRANPSPISRSWRFPSALWNWNRKRWGQVNFETLWSRCPSCTWPAASLEHWWWI